MAKQKGTRFANIEMIQTKASCCLNKPTCFGFRFIYDVTY